jgi:tripartite ATP-independent transporter DctM subunit
MNETAIGIVGMFALLMLFLTGIELGFGMAIVGFIGFTYLRGFDAALALVASDFFEAVSSYGLTVIPLFILMGQVAFEAGIAGKLYTTAHRFVGHIAGGLAMATVLGATMFKAVCGSSPATAATFASIAVPEMDKRGYAKKLSTGTVASCGTLGLIIPPSVCLIIFGIVTELSIGKLFLAGLFPGLLIAFFFGVIIYAWCKMDPSLGPPVPRSSWKERMTGLPDVLWPAIVFILVIGGLMKGLFTPTEAGSIGTIAVIILVSLKKELGLKKFIASIKAALKTACMVLMLVVGSTIFGHFLAQTKIPMNAADWLLGLEVSPFVMIMLIIVIYNIGGSFIDDFAFMMLATPVFFPIVMKIGFDPYWFGVIIMVAMMIGGIIPPVAMNVFVVKNITGVPFGVVYRGCVPFLVALGFAIIVLYVFPQIATYLPSVYMK